MKRTMLACSLYILLLSVAGILRAQEIPDMLFAILAEANVSPDTTSLMKAIGSHPDEMVRFGAIEILGLRKEAVAREVLLRSLSLDPNGTVREASAIALARLGDPAGLAALKKFQKESADPEQRVFLAGRLSEFGSADGYQEVTRAARSEQASMRVLAAETLSGFIPLKDLPGEDPGTLFLSLAEDKDVSVQRSFVLFFPIAVKNGLDITRARPVVERLSQTASDVTVRDTAVRFLEDHPPDEKQR